jgi:uncharacterized membrane protein YhaH (DUF805 family)
MDPDQQHAANVLAGLSFGFILFGLLIILAFVAFWIFLYWRIFAKAGMSGALSLLILLPFLGYPIVLCILAFGEWKVIPAPVQYGQLYPPPPPGYPPPPPSYPPPPPPAI